MNRYGRLFFDNDKDSFYIQKFVVTKNEIFFIMKKHNLQTEIYNDSMVYVKRKNLQFFEIYVMLLESSYASVYQNCLYATPSQVCTNSIKYDDKSPLLFEFTRNCA